MIFIVFSSGVTGLHYLEAEKQLSDDGEVAICIENDEICIEKNEVCISNEELSANVQDTVDGSHPTDLGFVRQADAFEAALVRCAETMILC